ncbi:MAG: flagellar hook-basal body protein [Thermoflexaceae bacterium]|nr:flagellar hook-basal body protein [Thermoflexaceae bacterium]
MIKGLYTAFTALDGAWQYQDMLANNIANATTTGFKREVAVRQSFSDVLLSRQVPVPAPLSARIQEVVGQIGTGSFVAEFSTDFAGGAFASTGGELDLALGAGFFSVETPDGQIFYTRDGRFGRDAYGDLVTSHGYYVLDTDGAHINLPSERLSVAPDGQVTAAGEPVATIQVVDFAPAQLTRAGEAYFSAQEPGVLIDGGIRQGYLEGSNTNLVEELTSLLAVQRTYQANQTILARLDGTLDLAAGQLGQMGG